MASQKNNFLTALPVFFGFFIMGFVDVVGISTNYVKHDFELNDTHANLLPMMVFLWFFIFSIPTGMLMNRIGRKATVLISMVITLAAMLIPLVSYQFGMMLVAFALLGIGNTILQVSLNPLLTNVVSENRTTSSLTLGQFVKAISAFLGPIVAGVAAGTFGNWKLIFPIYAGITILSSAWLLLTPVPRESVQATRISFAQSFGLLSDRVILMSFLGILLVVGIDVGLNTTIPKILMERTAIPIERAGLGTSLYFAARTLGTFIGAIVLVRFPARRFFTICMVVAIPALLVLMPLSSLWGILVLIFIVGLACANVFSIIFSLALSHRPDRTNDISALMVMGVGGAAIVLPIMGWASDAFGQMGALVVLLVCLVYLLYCSLSARSTQTK